MGARVIPAFRPAPAALPRAQQLRATAGGAEALSVRARILVHVVQSSRPRSWAAIDWASSRASNPSGGQLFTPIGPSEHSARPAGALALGELSKPPTNQASQPLATLPRRWVEELQPGGAIQHTLWRGALPTETVPHISSRKLRNPAAPAPLNGRTPTSEQACCLYVGRLIGRKTDRGIQAPLDCHSSPGPSGASR